MLRAESGLNYSLRRIKAEISQPREHSLKFHFLRRLRESREEKTFLANF